MNLCARFFHAGHVEDTADLLHQTLLVTVQFRVMQGYELRYHSNTCPLGMRSSENQKTQKAVILEFYGKRTNIAPTATIAMLEPVVDLFTVMMLRLFSPAIFH